MDESIVAETIAVAEERLSALESELVDVESEIQRLRNRNVNKKNVGDSQRNRPSSMRRFAEEKQLLEDNVVLRPRIISELESFDDAGLTNQIKVILRSKNRSATSNVAKSELRQEYSRKLVTVFYGKSASKKVRINVGPKTEFRDLYNCISSMWNIALDAFELAVSSSPQENFWLPQCFDLSDLVVSKLMELSKDSKRGYGCCGQRSSEFLRDVNNLPPLYLIRHEKLPTPSLSTLVDGLSAHDALTFPNFIRYVERYQETRAVDFERAYISFYLEAPARFLKDEKMPSFAGIDDICLPANICTTLVIELGETAPPIAMPHHAKDEDSERGLKERIDAIRAFFWIMAVGAKNILDDDFYLHPPSKELRITEANFCKSLVQVDRHTNYGLVWVQYFGKGSESVDWETFQSQWANIWRDNILLEIRLLDHIRLYESDREYHNYTLRNRKQISWMALTKFVLMIFVFLLAFVSGSYSTMKSLRSNRSVMIWDFLGQSASFENAIECSLQDLFKGGGSAGISMTCFFQFMRANIFNLYFQGSVICNFPDGISQDAFDCFLTDSNQSFVEGTTFAYNYFRPQYILMRQLRVKETPCPYLGPAGINTMFGDGNFSCLGWYTNETQQTTPIYGFESTSYGQFSSYPYMNSIPGTFGTYGPYGYGVELGRLNSSITDENDRLLQSALEFQFLLLDTLGVNQGWLQYSSRALIVDIALFNPNKNALLSLTLLWEMSPSLVTAIRLDSQEILHLHRLMIPYWILLVFALAVMVLEIATVFRFYKDSRRRWHDSIHNLLKNPTMLLFVLIVAVCVAIIVLDYHYLKQRDQYFALASPNNTEMWNLQDNTTNFNKILRLESMLVLFTLIPLCSWFDLSSKFQRISQAWKQSIILVVVWLLVQLYVSAVIAFALSYTSAYAHNVFLNMVDLMSAVIGGSLSGFTEYENPFLQPPGYRSPIPPTFYSVIFDLLALVYYIVIGMGFPAGIVAILLHAIHAHEMRTSLLREPENRSLAKTLRAVITCQWWRSCKRNRSMKKLARQTSSAFYLETHFNESRDPDPAQTE